MKKTITILSLAILACTQAMAQTRDTVALENFDAYLSKAKGEVCVAVTGVTDESRSIDSLSYSLRKYPKVSVDLALVGNPQLTEIYESYYGPGKFQYCNTLRKITLPEGVKRVSGFKGLSNLQEVSLPESLKGIGAEAFSGCTSLRSISIPIGVGKIEERAFFNCSSLTRIEVKNPNVVFTPTYYKIETLFIYTYDGEGITSYSPEFGPLYSDHIYIANSAFWGCDILQSKEDPAVGIINGKKFPYIGTKTKEFVLQDTIKVTRYDHISGIANLESLTINANEEGRWGVYYRDDDIDMEYPQYKPVVTNCPKLKSLTISNDIQELGGILDCESLETVNLPDTMTIFYGIINAPKLQRIKIPYGLNCIPCFNNCHSLKEVIIPGEIEEELIDHSDNNFNNCYSLEKVVLPKGLKQLNSIFGPSSDVYGTFGNCRALKEIVIPEGIEVIQQGTFYGCTSLMSVTIPSTVKKIEHHAFAGCKSLKAIHLPDSLVEIGDFAFEGCESLKTINIPQSCTIGKGVFWACKSLAKGKNPKTIKVCGRELDYYGTNVVAEFSGSVPRTYFSGFTSLRSVEIRGVVTDIKAGAFDGCINLKSIKWPKDLIVIGEKESSDLEHYFNGFMSMEKLEIPEGVLQVYDFPVIVKELTLPSTIHIMNSNLSEDIQKLTIKSDNYLPDVLRIFTWNDGSFGYGGILPIGRYSELAHPIDIYVKPHLIPEYEADMQKAVECRAVMPEVLNIIRFHAIED